MKKPAKSSKPLGDARAAFEAKRESLKVAFLKSGNVEALLSGLTRMVDELIASRVSSDEPVAVVAVGGYGREELFPYSDIDLLFLYEKEAAAAARVAESVLYFLWDLGLVVGQAHRSVDEAIALAKDDITIRTNLLDARFLAGDKKIFAHFQKKFAADIAAEGALAFVEAKLAERDNRHLHFGDSRYMLEPNVKEGKGGLRDLHTLWWLARYAYPIERLEDLVRKKLLSREEYRMFDQSREFLCKVRAHLHILAGRAEERLTFDRQHALALAMGFSHPSNNRAVERFMQRYFVAVRTVGSITRIFCALLEEEKKSKPKKRLAWLWQAPWALGPFKLDGERLDIKSKRAFEQQPILMLEIFRVSQQHGIDIHPRALQLIARALLELDRNVQNDPKANQIFLDILLSPKDAEPTLRRMSEAGVMGRFIPDFGRVIGRTQFNMYHVFTVDEHTLVALGNLHALESGAFKAELPLASEVISRIKMRRVLFVALLCHDIAKGRGGDHSELGETISAKLAKRFGFSADEIETVAWLVKNHLLFSETAFKRDLDDPKTVQDFVALVRSAERLKLLLTLTVADIRAVAPTVWNGWKASLMRELYARAEQMIGTGRVEIKQQQAGQFLAALRKQLPSWQPRDVEAYLEQGNPSFMASFDIGRHAAIARMLKEAQVLELPILLSTSHDYERRVTEIIVCTPDQHGLFSKIAGAMALAGANIINAKIFTMKDGMAIDAFQVQDTAGDAFDRPDKLAKLSVYLEQALTEKLDIAATFAKKRDSASARKNALSAPGQVFIDNDASNVCTVIELVARDRVGFLYRVTRAMAELGLSIATAHIFTYGTQVADVFYVKDPFGMKITHDAKMKQVRERLLEAINGA